MASSFMGLFVQRDGLNYAQKALDITGSNLLNSKVPGYSRQKLDLTSAFVNNGTLGYNNQIFLAGAGVEGQGVTQVRDEILDDKHRVINARVNTYTAHTNVLSHIEDALDDIENEKTGFAFVLNEFKDSWQAFSSTGTDQTDLANIAKNSAQAVIDVLKNFNNRIENVRDDAFDDVKNSVKTVNDIFRQCAAINEDIKSGYVLYGDFYQNGYYDGEGNDYKADNNYGPLENKDMMNMLIDQLSNYGDVKVKVEEDGTYTISMAGKNVVELNKYAVLTYDVKYKENDALEPDEKDLFNRRFIPASDKIVEMEELNFELSELKTDKKWHNSYIQLEDDTVTDGFDEKMVAELKDCLLAGDFNKARNIERQMLADAGANANPKYVPVFDENKSISDYDSLISQGMLRGQLDMYNGAGVYSKTDPNGANGIPYYKKTIDALATAIHDEFNAVYAVNDQDFKMFDFEPDMENTAEGLILSEKFSETPILAVHPEGDAYVDDNYEQIANTWVNRLASVFEAKHTIGKEGQPYKFDEFVKFYGNMVGTAIKNDTTFAESEGVMLKGVDERRNNAMGVSTDEEGVHMLTYQKWYNAMARMTTTLDELLDKLINNTGRVGL